MPPTSKREQLALDELLSDIYRGIETLPDNSNNSNNNNNATYGTRSKGYAKSGSFLIRQDQTDQLEKALEARNVSRNPAYQQTYELREYELPASSPLVKHHKKQLETLKSQPNWHQQQQQQQQQRSYISTPKPQVPVASKQPQRSTLKRYNTPDANKEPQSLASFITGRPSATPENKRRVRIVDHPDKLAKGYQSNGDDDDEELEEDDDDEADYAGSSKRSYASPRSNKREKVKYVNTNKFIYHQEQNPDDEILSSDEEQQQQQEHNRNNHDEDDNDGLDDDLDGVTRVEYYHTSWLDRQLGRASKRRDSKELTERQVKEKAMIEELKRSLKNGAITLRRSFRGKKNSSNIYDTEPQSNGFRKNTTLDDQNLSRPNPKKQSHSVFGSGLATVPRNYHNSSQRGNSYAKPTEAKIETTHHQTKINNNYDTSTAPKQTNRLEQAQPMQNPSSLTSSSPASYSRTLPHNYNQSKKGGHQLIESHYRGANNRNFFNTISNSNAQQNFTTTPSGQTAANTSTSMKNPDWKNNYGANNCAPTNQITKTPDPVNKYDPYNRIRQQQLVSQSPVQHHHQQQQQQWTGERISSIPSATEVVRSALSRSSSQVSLNQLNKTINLLPNSPPPYGQSPAATPTQQLRAASPSLSPSPIKSPAFYSKTIASGYADRNRTTNQQQQNQLQTQTLHGTRVIPPRPLQEQQQHQQQQTAYANPHNSLMQHKMEQQSKQQFKNHASLREFNELDSLLKSLNPTSSTQITPGYTSKPSQPTFGGYGYTPSTVTTQQRGPADVYARIQKAPSTQPQPQHYYQPQAQQQPHHHYPNQQQQQQQHPPVSQSPFTIDVSDKKDELCVEKQDLSEFEPPIELIPSMEDYQNISKLNPVRNNYWYKPNMGRDRAISLLKDKPQGTFIVRDSNSFKGAYGLAVKVSKLPKNAIRNPNLDPSSELIRHFLIEPTSDGVRLKGYANEPVFNSLPSLIYQHSLTQLALPCRLVIPRADIEDPNFNYKQKQFYDEFVVSKEQAKHSPYDRTSPNGGYRRYPGDVLVHNEHRIIFE